MASTISAGTTSGTAIAIAGDTTGNLAFQTQAGANTITVPNSTGTIVTTGSPQSGSVLQVVSSQYNTSFTTSSASMVASGLSASITPKFSTSKILAIFSLNFTSGGANNQATTTLYRNSTNLALSGGVQTAFGQVYGSAGIVQGGTSASCLDSPATTSATTYAVYVASTNGGSITAFNNTTTGVITLMEIAG